MVAPRPQPCRPVGSGGGQPVSRGSAEPATVDRGRHMWREVEENPARRSRACHGSTGPEVGEAPRRLSGRQSPAVDIRDATRNKKGVPYSTASRPGGESSRQRKARADRGRGKAQGTARAGLGAAQGTRGYKAVAGSCRPRRLRRPTGCTGSGGAEPACGQHRRDRPESVVRRADIWGSAARALPPGQSASPAFRWAEMPQSGGSIPDIAAVLETRSQPAFFSSASTDGRSEVQRGWPWRSPG